MPGAGRAARGRLPPSGAPETPAGAYPERAGHLRPARPAPASAGAARGPPAARSKARPNQPPLGRPHTGPGHQATARARRAPRPKRQPSIALRPNAVGRGQWGARGSGQPRRRRPQAPDRGSRGCRGPGGAYRAAAAARVEQAGRRGGPAHARRPLCRPAPAAATAAPRLSRGRPGPPPPSAPDTPPPSCLPPPPPCATSPPHARRGPAPRGADVHARWPNLPAPPPQRTLPPPPIGPFGPGRAPERGLVLVRPRPRGGYCSLIGPRRRPSSGGGGKQAVGGEAVALTWEGLKAGVGVRKGRGSPRNRESGQRSPRWPGCG